MIPLWPTGLLVGSLLLAGGPALAGEAEFRDRICAGMATEVPAGGRSRADCATKDLAIEIDFSDHWAQAVGQALYYADALNRRAGVVLICRHRGFPVTCNAHAFRAAHALRHAANATVWLCPEAARGLSGCRVVR